MRTGSIREALERRREGKAWVYGLSLGVGILGGSLAVAYRRLLELLGEWRPHLGAGFSWARIAVLGLWLPLAAVFGLAVAFLVRRAPLIGGSGIPQVKATLLRRIRPDWMRELPAKFLGGALSVGAGLSLGREGPSIQLGALAGSGLAALTGKIEYERYLVTAGAAAGISAAFNAPLAGVLFCLEELHRHFSPLMLGAAMTAAFSANAVSWLVLGNHPAFDFQVLGQLPLRLYPGILVLGIAAALLGAFFNRGIIAAQDFYRHRIPRLELRFASLFAAAAALTFCFPAIAGGGHALVGRMARAEFPLMIVAALIVGKLAFTLVSFGSGAPGGIFLPMLVIGALLGGLFGESSLGGPEALYRVNWMILGMTAFFTAVVRAPITGAILIAEMSGSFAHFPALILAAVVASLASELLHNRPIYEILLARLGGTAEQPSGDRAVLLHIPLLEGSELVGVDAGDLRLPGAAVVVGIARGEEELLPQPGLALVPGDVLLTLAPESGAGAIKRELLARGKPRAGHLESED